MKRIIDDGVYIWLICDALRDLVPFVQFKKREKHPWRSGTKSCNTWYQIVQRITHKLKCLTKRIGLLNIFCCFYITDNLVSVQSSQIIKIGWMRSMFTCWWMALLSLLHMEFIANWWNNRNSIGFVKEDGVNFNNWYSFLLVSWRYFRQKVSSNIM